MSRLSPLALEFLLWRRSHLLSSPRGMPRQFEALGRPESFEQLTETLGRANLPAEERQQVQRLREGVATCLEEARAQGAEQERAVFEEETQVGSDSRTLPLRQALIQLETEGDRSFREALEQGAARKIAGHPGPYVRRIEAAQQTAGQWGNRSYPAFRQWVTDSEPAGLLDACAEVLADTFDGYRDLLGHALKKLDPWLTPSNAQRHDLLFVASGLWRTPLLDADTLRAALRTWLLELPLCPPPAADEAPSRAGFAAAFETLHRVGLCPAAPGTRLPDAAVPEAWAALIRHQLLDEGWLGRYVGLSRPQARDMARWAAFFAVTHLRLWAARLPWELSLWDTGPRPSVFEDYAERMGQALCVQFPKGLALADREPHLDVTVRLRAMGLAGTLHHVCQGRFNEDYFRNPGASAWLKQQAALHVGETAESLQERWLGGKLSLRPLAQRLLSVMGA